MAPRFTFQLTSVSVDEGIVAIDAYADGRLLGSRQYWYADTLMVSEIRAPVVIPSNPSAPGDARSCAEGELATLAFAAITPEHVHAAWLTESWTAGLSTIIRDGMRGYITHAMAAGHSHTPATAPPHDAGLAMAEAARAAVLPDEPTPSDVARRLRAYGAAPDTIVARHEHTREDSDVRRALAACTRHQSAEQALRRATREKDEAERDYQLLGEQMLRTRADVLAWRAQHPVRTWLHDHRLRSDDELSLREFYLDGAEGVLSDADATLTQLRAVAARAAHDERAAKLEFTPDRERLVAEERALERVKERDAERARAWIARGRGDLDQRTHEGASRQLHDRTPPERGRGGRTR